MRSISTELRPRRAIARLIALFAVAALCSCHSAGSGTSGGTATAAPPVRMVYPTGVLTTADAMAATQGIYPVPVGGGERCCWVDKDVRFFVPVPAGAKALRLDVTLPLLPGFAWKSQTVTELDSAGKKVAARVFPVGPVTHLSLPLPPRATYGLDLPVHLRLSTFVVPRDARVGPDSRRLAMILTDVYTR